jgi:hypothetical protein
MEVHDCLQRRKTKVRCLSKMNFDKIDLSNLKDIGKYHELKRTNLFDL